MLGVTLSPASYSTLNEVGGAMIAPFVVTVALSLILAVILGRAGDPAISFSERPDRTHRQRRFGRCRESGWNVGGVQTDG
jgi:hypothetical protein